MRPIALMAVFLILVCPHLFARSANRVDHYDVRGRYIGTSYRMGNTTTYYDNYGKCTGEVVHDSKRDYASYTGQGKYNGHTYKDGNAFEYYDGHGKYTGSTTTNGNSYEYFDTHDVYSGGGYAEGANAVTFSRK